MNKDKVKRRVGIALIHQGSKKIILVKFPKSHMWYDPGGKIESGETPIDAAKREIIEELTVSSKDFTFLCSRTYPSQINPKLQFCEESYTAITTEMPRANSEISEVGLFTYKETKELPIMKSTQELLEIAHTKNFF